MPIKPILLQRRHAELGRIRLGAKGNKGQPQKLSRFRFTSPSESYIRDIAELYGGEARPWDNNGKPEFEVFTDASTIPVFAVKGGLSQWMETWTGGGIAHRCDGEYQADGTPCSPDDPNHIKANPTTRLSVMLPELDAIGVWRLESHGWNAAAEIPAVAELAQYIGELVPAVLHLVERRTVKDGRTSRFVVPVLDLRIGVSRLRELAAEKAGIAQVAAPAEARQIAAPATADQTPIEAMTDADELRALWKQREDLRPRIKARAAELKRTESAAAGDGDGEAPTPAVAPETAAAGDDPPKTSPAAAPSSGGDGGSDGVVDEVVDGEIVEDPPGFAEQDANAVWQEILRVGGEQGMSLGDVEDHFAQENGGLVSADASAAELQLYLAKLRSEAA